MKREKRYVDKVIKLRRQVVRKGVCSEVHHHHSKICFDVVGYLENDCFEKLELLIHKAFVRSTCA